MIELPASTIALGMITGLGYGLLSTGLVIVYRSNRIINFAHGEIGALGAASFLFAVRRWGVPYYVMFPAALAVGGGVAALAELAVVRRLRNAPRLMSLVATLGLAQLLVVVTFSISGSASGGPFFPEPPGLPTFEIGSLIVHPSASGLLFLSPVVVIGLAVFFRRSRSGLAMRSAAANPDAARMAGVYASRMSTLAWAIGGTLSTFTAVLVAPTLPGGLLTGASFGPALLLRGLVGAIVARMTSIPIAMASGVGIGIVEGVLLRNVRSGGVTEVVLFGIILLALLTQFREGSREGERGSVWASVQPWRPLPEALSGIWVVRNLGWIIAGVALVAVTVPPIWMSNVTATTLTSLLGFGMVALSVWIVTGLGGQLTLGQFALAAVGALVSYRISTRTGGNPLALLGGGAAAAMVTLVIGLPALRIKGLFLAVTTLSFGVAMSSWFLQQPWALGDRVIPPDFVVAGRPIATGRSYYYLALVVFVMLYLLARNVRTSGIGRRLLAVRDNEDAARAFGVRARSIKIQGFLLAGFVAGVGGAVYGHSFAAIDVQQFLAQASIDAVVIAVVGGIGTLAGPILGVLLVRGIPAFVPVEALALFASRLGLLLLILYFPGGVVQLVAPLRERVIAWLGRRYGVDVSDEEPAEATPVVVPAQARVAREPGPPILVASSIAKSYGGLTAVNDVSLSVDEGATVGLIGPNGAGKTTLFEILSGFVAPDSGRVTFDGRDVTRWSPEGRAARGLIRSFQDVSLFPTLTVLETVQVALERQLPTAFTRAVLGLRAREREREEVAHDLVRSMGLSAYRSKQIQELSTGTRRIVELACLVALEPKVLLLDEPSSGIAQRETEALGAFLQQLKDRHAMTLVVIEHDIPLIMSLADTIVAMDAGTVIASGPPESIRHDPRVIESYLGGRLEAIERSGEASAT